METKVIIKMLRALDETMKKSETYKMYHDFDFTKERTTEIDKLKDTILTEYGDLRYELRRITEALETIEKYEILK